MALLADLGQILCQSRFFFWELQKVRRKEHVPRIQLAFIQCSEIARSRRSARHLETGSLSGGSEIITSMEGVCSIQELTTSLSDMVFSGGREFSESWYFRA